MELRENLVVADKFRLTRMIGKGGMGSVWQAQHLGLDTPCALKFIEGEIAGHTEAQARFEREAKAAAHLRSPHVVQIFDHGVWQGVPYIAMELLEGEDLGRRLARRGRLPPEEIVAVVQQVARALTKAHAAGVVHRDLKPDNVFLVKDDDREIVKVLDFGVAKQTAGLDGSNTKTGAMLGTPYYMSPEQAQGIKAVDHRSDLWSLAIIVYEALTGLRPFDSEALGDLLVKIIVSPVPVPSQVAPGMTPAFDAWWTKAASRDPQARFGSARELSDALTQALLGGPVRAALGSMSDISSEVSAVSDAQAAAMVAQRGAALTPSGQHASPFPGSRTPTPAGPPNAMAQSGSTQILGTFNGSEAPVVARAGFPLPLVLGGVGAVLAVVLGLGAFAVLRSKGDAAAGGEPLPTTQASTTAHAEPPPETPPVTPPPTAEAPKPTEDPKAAHGDPKPVPAAEDPKPLAKTDAPRKAKEPAAVATASAKPAASSKPVPAKKPDLGF